MPFYNKPCGEAHPHLKTDMQQADTAEVNTPKQLHSVAPPLTHVLFLSPSCHEVLEQDTTDYRRLVARRPIKRGSLVLLEHTMTVPAPLMRMTIKHDEAAFNRLCPRDPEKLWADHEDKNSKEMEELVVQKMACNAIGNPQELMSLALGFTAINHAFPSNCAMRTVRVTESPMKKDVVLMFLYVVAKHDIGVGQEITVTYATAAEEDHSFIRTPSQQEIDAELAIEEEVLRETTLHFRAIDQYLEKKAWVGISARHKMMVDGVYLAPNYMVMADECMERVPEDFRRYLVDVLVQEKEMNAQYERGDKDCSIIQGEELQKRVGEPGSKTRKRLEMESVFRWEWERTLQLFKDFEFRGE